jgi:uncharacterized protein (TIGR03083 family)
MGAMQQICRDLAAEHADLDRVVAGLEASDWDRATPAVGWSVRDQISHLGYFDRTAVLAADDPAAFARSVEALLAGGVDASVEPGRAMTPTELLACGVTDAASCWPCSSTSTRRLESRGTARRWERARLRPRG